MGAETLGSDGRIKDRTGIAAQGAVVSAFNATTTQAIAAATDTVVQFPSKDFDPFGWFDTSAYRFTPKVAGYYRVSASVMFQNGPAAGTYIYVDLRKNGARYKRTQKHYGGNNFISGELSAVVYLNGSTDYVDVIGACGAAVTMNGGYNNATDAAITYFQANLVGVSTGVVPEPWHIVGATGEPAFQNSWVNYDTTRTARFYKDPYGMVHLAGLVKNGLTSPSAIFTLPAGYRPSLSPNINFAVAANGAFGQLSVATDGTVVLQNGSNVWVDLSSVHVRAEQ